MSNKVKGIVLTGLLSMIVVFIFFGKIIQDPNNYYFASEGDGFKAYYGAIYHLEHDTSSMRMNGMNYPYGEMVFFTGSQPMVVNTVKFISNNLVDISDNIVGIINLLMIFSIVIAAMFVFLIFFELNINWIYASVVALGICVLSPQIARFGGHFSLSWLFWIPLMIYLVIRFDKKPTYLRAILIGLITFLASAMHMYFFGFYGFIIGLYLLSQIVNKNRKFGFLKGLLFFTIQFVLPFVVLQLIISANDPVTDRTAFPYGFFAYRGHPIAVFFPSGRPYAFVPKVLKVFEHIPWEALGFIGVTALGGFVFGMVSFFKRIIKKSNPLKVTDSFVLNVLFWSSFAALLFSFGIPFIFGLEGLVDKLGPLKQLRALARFSWFFFYMLSIVVFYVIYQKIRESKTTNSWRIVGILAFAFLIFDGFWNIYLNSRPIQNRKPAMEDRANETAVNDWLNKINPDDYQAILPLPYFHVGSENIWIESKQNNQELTMIASLKTGLPTTGVQLSRTSIAQTYKNYALVTEPIEPFKVIEDLPNNKPFLLLYNRKHYPNDDEKRLIFNAELIYQNDEIELRKLSVEKLKSFRNNYSIEIKNEYLGASLFDVNGVKVTDSTSFFIVKDFNENNTAAAFGGDGALKYSSMKWETVFEDTLKNVRPGEKYIVSFWMHNYKKDGFLRANVEFIQKEIDKDKTTGYFYSDVHRHIKAFDGDWALIEFNVEIKSENEYVKLSLINKVLKNTEFELDELIIREKEVDIYYQSNQIHFKNGRRLILTP